ncbi:rhodanese-like domain-containing protein [Kitasatospora sp. NBC_00070]|uniref:rhodanese-like domain-containing protein n=1 Tax=Kitasatospora sp. NBC_00070 TaxID=2975962 RepID=UPI0032537F73
MTTTAPTAAPAAVTSPVTEIPALSPERAFGFFAERLGCQADPADVWYALRDGRQDFTIVDVRAEGAHRKTHLPGAVSLPLAEITAERLAELPAGLLVVYCWGPACNGSTKGAMKLAALGREVKEMIGGLEYWIREGWPTEGRRPVDPKTATPADLGLVC